MALGIVKQRLFGLVLLAFTCGSHAKDCDLNVWLELDGAVANKLQWTKSEFKVLPTSTLSTETQWSAGKVNRFEGPKLQELLRAAGVSKKAKTIVLLARNDYRVSIDMSDVEKYDPVVSHSMDGMEHEATKYAPTWLVFNRSKYSELKSSKGTAMFAWGLCKITVKE